jgi:two-component system cell cycle sensor histidine kinase/response regulator CckA
VLTLSRAGYTMIEADGGPAAIGLAEEHEGGIDLLVTDVVMPEMSGRQLASALTHRRPGIRKMFISDYTENTIVHHGVLDADVAFLGKPFTPTALLRKAREVLDCWRRRAALRPNDLMVELVRVQRDDPIGVGC